MAVGLFPVSGSKQDFPPQITFWCPALRYERRHAQPQSAVIFASFSSLLLLLTAPTSALSLFIPWAVFVFFVFLTHFFFLLPLLFLSNIHRRSPYHPPGPLRPISFPLSSSFLLFPWLSLNRPFCPTHLLALLSSLRTPQSRIGRRWLWVCSSARLVPSCTAASPTSAGSSLFRRRGMLVKWR